MRIQAPAATMAPNAPNGVGSHSKQQAGGSFKAQCKSAAALVNERRIEFVRAKKARVLGKLESTGSNSLAKSAGNGKVLVDEGQIVRLLSWKQSRKIGPGLSNLGNTCYLNSVLQCLSYTPCFAQYVLEKEAKSVTKNGHNNHAKGFCGLRVMARFLQNIHGGGSGNKHGGSRVIQPKELVMNIRHISKSFRIGRQEDSHEFFRLLLDAMQRSCLRRAGIKQESHPSASTSMVHRVFGGKLKNSLKCAKCSFVSERCDDFLDLSLEINNGIKSIAGALKHFTAVEKLDDSNAWKCTNCRQLNRAEKGMTIETCPNVLVIQLKRFDMMFGKIKKHIEFPTSLDIARGVSKTSEDRRRGRTKYELHGVLVHAGYSTECGHYYAFVKGPSGQWYEMNDECVRWVNIDQVLQQKAYMLFYSRVLPPSEVTKETPTAIAAPPETTSVAAQPTKEEIPTKIVSQSSEEASSSMNQSLDMNGFLASLKTDLNNLPIGAKNGHDTGVARERRKHVVVTYEFTRSRSLKPHPRQRRQAVVPVFRGALGKFYKYNRSAWCTMRGVQLKCTSSEHSSPESACALEQNVQKKPQSQVSGQPVNPRQLRRIGAPGGAVFGKEVARWSEAEAADSTSADINQDLAAHQDAILNRLKKEDRKRRQSGRQDSWNESLDMGKLKKVKKRKEFMPNQGAANAFQKALQKKAKRQ